MAVRHSLVELGFEGEAVLAAAHEAADALRRAGNSKKKIGHLLREVKRRPGDYRDDALFGPLAEALLAAGVRDDDGLPAAGYHELRETLVPHAVWGRELMDERTLEQFETACRLPVAVRGAQMPDGHVGYGLPIGGVLATRGCVIPYAVGVDIACRMRLSIFDEPLGTLQDRRDSLKRALWEETRFGVGAHFEAETRRRHEVLDDPAWSSLELLRQLKSKAWAQLGTSGSGNHFVEFGELTSESGIAEVDLPPGRYLALLSHSGSRGLGAEIAAWFTSVARGQCRLPRQAEHLAWLDLASDAGQSYWTAMTLAGRYAAANHELVHQHVTAAAGLTVRATVENHHNYAWLEEHDGETLVVHRKGATPAGPGVLGVIPGSMGDPGYVVRGRGRPESLHSAAHGAGRQMSRKAATKSLTRQQRGDWLRERGVELLAGGLDESPQAYKRIGQVMAAQGDLVDPLAEFMPRLVLMARGGPAED